MINKQIGTFKEMNIKTEKLLYWTNSFTEQTILLNERLGTKGIG